ncbi:MAG: hypothetical protein ABJ042_12685, partial [Lentilitoribacter sp.]
SDSNREDLICLEGEVCFHYWSWENRFWAFKACLPGGMIVLFDDVKLSRLERYQLEQRNVAIVTEAVD